MELRVGILPLPVYVLAGTLIAGFVASGKLPISLAIVMFAFFRLHLRRDRQAAAGAAQRRRGGHLRHVTDSGLSIGLRRSKYDNNLVEQDHRVIKRRSRPMIGFDGLTTAAQLIAGIESMHMIKRGCSVATKAWSSRRPVLQFCSLATR
jgi:hypothetical protein